MFKIAEVMLSEEQIKAKVVELGKKNRRRF